MTTHIIQPDLLDFTERVLEKLGVARVAYQFEERTVLLPRNPTDSRGGYVLLVPRDILRDLPIALDWEDISTAASKNTMLRVQLNRFVGRVWKARSRRDKAELRSTVIKDRNAFEALLAVIKAVPRNPYDLNADPRGLVSWTDFVRMAVDKAQLDLEPFRGKQLAISEICEVVDRIVDQFKTLVERKGVWKTLWNDRAPRSEKHAQLVFFAIADSYCKAYDLDLTPEADSNNGPVDFKISHGFSKRVLVEIKLSTNSKLVPGYEKQLETYKAGEETAHAVYLVIDLGDLRKRADRLLETKNRLVAAGKRGSSIVFVDGSRKLSASRR